MFFYFNNHGLFRLQFPYHLNMSIQMTLVFGILVTQMTALLLLLLPLPHVVRMRLLDGYAVLKRNTNVRVGVVFTTILLGLQFLDCVKKVRRYATLDNPYYAQFNAGQPMALLPDKLASKFYAQRNLYITGAVLYLELAIQTVITILDKLVRKENSYRELAKTSKSTESEDEEIRSLRDQIAKKEVDIKALKKQLTGLQSAYDGLNESKVNAKDE